MSEEKKALAERAMSAFAKLNPIDQAYALGGMEAIARQAEAEEVQSNGKESPEHSGGR